jgi:hypothetical protein
VSCAKDADCCGRENGWEGQDPCTFASQAMTVLTYNCNERIFPRSLFAFIPRYNQRLSKMSGIAFIKKLTYMWYDKELPWSLAILSTISGFQRSSSLLRLRHAATEIVTC